MEYGGDDGVDASISGCAMRLRAALISSGLPGSCSIARAWGLAAVGDWHGGEPHRPLHPLHYFSGPLLRLGCDSLVRHGVTHRTAPTATGVCPDRQAALDKTTATQDYGKRDSGHALNKGRMLRRRPRARPSTLCGDRSRLRRSGCTGMTRLRRSAFAPRSAADSTAIHC